MGTHIFILLFMLDALGVFQGIRNSGLNGSGANSGFGVWDAATVPWKKAVPKPCLECGHQTDAWWRASVDTINPP